MTENDIDIDAVVNDHKEETSDGRHATEAAVEKDDVDDGPDTLADAVADAFEAIDGGDVSSNLTLRDEKLAALFRGLEAVDELADVGEKAAAQLDRDQEDTETRAAVLRLLVRIGLTEVDESVIQAGQAGRKQYLDADEF
jgi:hypothetical protein